MTAFVPKNAAPRDIRELYHWAHKQVKDAGEAADSKPATATSSVPATATSPGEPGTIAYDSTHLYICIASSLWRRVGVSSW